MSELFQNQSIELKDLPLIDPETFKPIENAYKLFLHLRNGLLFILIFSIVILFQLFGNSELLNWHFAIIYISIFIFWILSFGLVELGFPRKKYILRQHDLVYQTGYLIQNTTAIPKNRIQHVEIRQSILLRIFKLSRLVIYTAGGSSSDLSISGIKPEEAELLKEHISLSISEHE